MPPQTSNASLYDQTIAGYISAPSDSRHSLITALTNPITTLFHAEGIEACESDLWTLWASVLDVAISTPASDSTAHISLVSLVRDIKSLGPLTSRSSDGKAVTDFWAGRLYSDLPILLPSIRHKFNDAPPKISGEAWANLNIFVARLTSTDVVDGSLFGIWTLRMGLEVERPLNARVEGQKSEAEMQRTTGDVSVDELLPSVLAWFEGAGEQMTEWCHQDRLSAQDGEGKPDPAKPGSMAQNGETGAEEDGLASGGVTGQGKMVARVDRGGYNVERWAFWRARLKVISEMRDNAGGRDKVAKLAYQAFAVMKSKGDDKFGIKD